MDALCCIGFAGKSRSSVDPKFEIMSESTYITSSIFYASNIIIIIYESQTKRKQQQLTLFTTMTATSTRILRAIALMISIAATLLWILRYIIHETSPHVVTSNNHWLRGSPTHSTQNHTTTTIDSISKNMQTNPSSRSTIRGSNSLTVTEGVLKVVQSPFRRRRAQTLTGFGGTPDPEFFPLGRSGKPSSGGQMAQNFGESKPLVHQPLLPIFCHTGYASA